MRLTRRRFFVGPVLGWALSRVGPAYSEPVIDTTPFAPFAPLVPGDATLHAYVDVLIPADETPSGTALGVDKQLRVVAKGKQDYERLIDLGLAWLNRQARSNYGRTFAELDERGREAVVARAAVADYMTLQRVFFERTRADAFFHYYGRPESWRGIRHYRGPPQPLGFMDYTQAPRSSR